MIRFFRSIRQGLVNEGKTSKYLRYAVGEILLVMIGILLALQVNNWNEGRLERLEERDSLIQLIEELETHVLFLEEWVLKRKKNNQKYKELLTMLDGAPIGDPFEFLSSITQAASGAFGQAGVSQTTYNELVNSGSFSLIENKGLRHQIADYYKMIVEQRERGNARIGEFGKLSYELIPRNLDNLGMDSEGQVQVGLTQEEYAEIAEAVLNSDLKRHATSLINRYHLNHVLLIEALERAKELISQIDTELNL